MSLGKNPDRTLEIIRQFNDGWTLQKTGDFWGLSRERVRQLLKRAGANTPELKESRREKRRKARCTSKKCEICGSMYSGKAIQRKCDNCKNLRLPTPQRYTDEQYLDELRRLSDKIGYTAGVTDIIREGRMSHVSFYRRFGSLRKAQELAGYESHRTGAPGHRDKTVKS
jgi:hypothetical protein